MEFPEQMVLKIAKQSPVIVIFVGMLMKTGFLSGSAACRWYINEEIEDIQRFYERWPSIYKDIINSTIISNNQPIIWYWR